MKIPFRRATAAVLVLVAAIACDMATSFKETLDESKAVADAIEKQAGARPSVGFRYNNGSLTSVTVQFRTVPAMGVAELERVARAAVRDNFKNEPKTLEISFAFEKST